MAKRVKPKAGGKRARSGTMYLIAEYCEGPFYMGWHLYLRESDAKNQRNADGEWGWLHYSPSQVRWDERNGTSLHPCRAVFDALGIKGTILGGDGDDGTIGRFAMAHSLPRQRVSGKPRGCVRVRVDEWGSISLVNVRVVRRKRNG